MILLQLSINLLFFLILSFFVFYLPGFWIIKRTKELLEDQEFIIVSLCLGLVIFLLTAIILGILNLRFLTLPIILFIGALILIRFHIGVLTSWKVLFKDKLFSLLIVLGILTMGFINFPSGFQYKEGLMFWSSQGYDGTWHIALIEEIKKSLPPQSPIFSGEKLSNYHYFADIVMGEFYRIFPFFSVWDLYFRFFPILFSFMIIFSVYSFLARWQGSKVAGYLGIFFTVFVGSFGYVVSILRGGSIFTGETTFWAAQLNTIIGNPPHAISLSLISTTFLTLLIYQSSKKWSWLIICFVLAGFLSGFKVSAGVIILIGLAFASLTEIVLYRKFKILILTIFLGISNIVTFKLITKEGTSLLILQPWWMIHSMVQSSDRLGLLDWELKRQHYLSKGTWHAWLRVAYLEGLSFLIFFVGNLGMRIIGLVKVFTLRNPLELAIFAAMLSGLLIPILFVQKGVAFNSIQFMQYFLLMFGFFAAAGTFQILKVFKKTGFKAIFIFFVILFSVPTVIGNLTQLYGLDKTAISKISSEEISALVYLKDNSVFSDIILTAPFESFPKKQFFNLPKPIYVWYPTSYVSAVSARRTFLTAEEMATQTGFAVKERLEEINKFFNQKNSIEDLKFLREKKIKYIYLLKSEIRTPLNTSYLDKFFENNEAIIFKLKDTQ